MTINEQLKALDIILGPNFGLRFDEETIAAALQTLPEQSRFAYLDNLLIEVLGEDVAQGDGSYYEQWAICMATLPQKFKAFLQTHGKWVE